VRVTVFPATVRVQCRFAEVVVLLRDAVAAEGTRAERFAELPTELAHTGHLHAPARLLAAMERHPSGRGPELEGAVRTTDVANRRIVAVRPEQTTDATATACDLGRQLTSLTAALETLALDRQTLDVVEPGSSAHQGRLAFGQPTSLVRGQRSAAEPFVSR